MGSLKIWRDYHGNGGAHIVILVPGISAGSLDEQTCKHFSKFIEQCYGAPGSAITIWVYDHGFTPSKRECWQRFYDAGEDLLEQMVAKVVERPDVELVIIGHRLGVFLLKKALTLAHYRYEEHLPGPTALMNALQKFIMIGDPELHSDNRSEWATLVQECLQHTQKIDPDVYDDAVLDGLRRISEKFETLHLNSQSFQVQGQPVSKRKIWRTTKQSMSNCLCDATITVREWTTSQSDSLVFSSKGDKRLCVFHTGSKCHKPLLQITGGTHVPSGNLLLASTKTPQVDFSNVEHIESPTSELGSNQRLLEEGLHASQICRMAIGPSQATGSGDLDGTLEGFTSIDPQSQQDSPTEPHSNEHATANHLDADQIAHVAPLMPTRNIEISGVMLPSSTTDTASDCSGDKLSISSRSGPEGADAVSEDEIHRCKELRDASRRRPLPIQLDVPPHCENFIGRGALLEAIKAFLSADTGTEEASSQLASALRIAVLYGPAGIGKTQVVVQHTQQMEAAYDWVFWIRADHPTHIARSFHYAAIGCLLIDGRNEYRHSESTAKFKEWLCTTENRWLLIFDNIMDYAQLAPFIPDHGNGAIVFTSRQPFGENQFDFFGTAASAVGFPVEPLSPGEGEVLLRNALADEPELINNDTVYRLCDWSEGLPFVLDMAIRQIRSENLTILDYLDKVKYISPQHQKPHVDTNQEYPETVRIIAWLSNARIPTSLFEMCSVLAYLDPVEIDESILLAASFRKVPLGDLPTTRKELKERANLCSELSLICCFGNRLSWRHESLQNEFRESLSLDEQVRALHSTSLLLFSRWPQQRRLKNIMLGFWPEFDSLLTHVRYLSDMWVSHCWRNGSLETLIQDESFLNLLTRSIWYNSYIRGNGGEDARLQELAHNLYDYRSRALDTSLSSSLRLSYVPSRLVHIDRARKFCRLVDTKGLHHDYAALSHCWGSRVDFPRLTKATYQRLKEGVPYTTSRLLRDTISILELADVSYLWVDALCIVQDDASDCEAEASSMPDTFVNSKVSIVWSDSRDACTKLKWTSRAWVFQEVSLATRRFTLGDYVLHSHGSDDFSDQWFSRVVRRHILTLSDASPACTARSLPAITCPHQGCDTFVLRLHGHDGFPFLDLPKELMLELERGLFGDKNADQNLEVTQGPGDTAQSLRQESTSDIQEAASDAQESQEDEYTESIAQANRLIEEGLQASAERQNLRAVGHFFQAREIANMVKRLSPPIMKIHALTSIYIAATYLQDGSVDMSSRLVEASETLMALYHMPDHLLRPTAVQLKLMRGNILIAGGDHGKAQSLFLEALELAGEDAQGDTADFAAIARLKLAQTTFSKDSAEAIRLLKKSILHFEDQTTQRGQAQYARALYCKALFTGEEGRKQSYKRARNALEDVCEEFHLPQLPHGKLSRKDFEDVIELGCR